jgi:hypothetical protein
MRRQDAASRSETSYWPWECVESKIARKSREYRTIMEGSRSRKVRGKKTRRGTITKCFDIGHFVRFPQIDSSILEWHLSSPTSLRGAVQGSERQQDRVIGPSEWVFYLFHLTEGRDECEQPRVSLAGFAVTAGIDGPSGAGPRIC